MSAPLAAWAQLAVYPDNGVAQQDVCDLGPDGVLNLTGEFGNGGDDVLCDGTGPGASLRSDGSDSLIEQDNQGLIDASGVSIAANDHVAVQVFRHGFALLDQQTGIITRRLLTSLLADLGNTSGNGVWTGIPDIIWEPNERRFIMLFNTPATGFPLLLVSKSEDPTTNEDDWYVFYLDDIGGEHAALRLAAWPGVLLLTGDHISAGNYVGSSVFAYALDELESGSLWASAKCIDCSTKPWLAASISRPTEAALGAAAYLVTGKARANDPAVCPTYPICVGGLDSGVLIYRATPDFTTGEIAVSPANYVADPNLFVEKQPGALDSGDNFEPGQPRNFVQVVPQLDQVIFQNNAWTPYIAPVFLQTAAGAPRSAVFSNLTDRLAASEWRPTIWTTRENQLDDGSVSVIWEQIDVSAATPVLLQWGLEGGGNSHRWMPSLGVDKLGNMALGMSMSEPLLSSGNLFGPLPRYPRLAINMRLRTDTPNQLKYSNPWNENCPYTVSATGLEACSFQGQGDTPKAMEGGDGRWGGNSAMALMPDGCSFLYSNQLITAEGGIGGGIFTEPPPTWAQWRTRIAVVQLDPLCGETAKPYLAQTESDGINEPQPDTLYLHAWDEPGGSGLAGPPYCVIDGERVSAAFVGSLGGDTYAIEVPGNALVDCTAVDRAENETTEAFRIVADEPPQVYAFSVATNEDTAVSINFAAHVSDDLTPVQSLIYSVITGPSKGGLIAFGGSATYTPNPNVSGSDAITYQACDESGQCASAVVSIQINPVDDAPVAKSDSATLTEDDPATLLYVLANDVDVDGGPQAVASVSPASHGTVMNGTTHISYQPAANYCNEGGSPDQFTYSLTPGGSTATVSVTVACVNDSPQVIVDGPVLRDEGQTGSYTFSTVDPDVGDSFTLVTRRCGIGGVISNVSFSTITGAGSFDCVFTDGPALQVVWVQVADAAGAQNNTGGKVVTVKNVAPQPQVDAVAGGLAFIPVATWFDLEASFTDPGDDQFTADVDWDNDGNFDENLGAVIRSGFVASHAYATAGTYTIVLRVADEDGGAATASAVIEVLDIGAGLQRIADDLARQLGADPAKDPALQAAIDSLIGNNGGESDNGAKDKLAGGERATALQKLLDAQLALAAAGGPEVATPMLLIAQIARVVMESTVTEARDATGCQLPLEKSCSKGERKSFDKILAYASAGDVAYAAGNYVEAVAQFEQAVMLAEDLL